jgi:uncharacterized lipoprotein YddW (UPF0748 family)
MKELQLGVWHRPFERDLSEVRKTLSELKELGMTQLFVETYFNGQLIYPSVVSITPPHLFVGEYEDYGKDLLLAFIEEGKKIGVRVHAWVENFFVGRYDHVEDSFWYKNQKSWILQNRDHSYLQKNEVNYLFLDPANHEVTAYLSHIYDELLKNYEIESLHLDYIRYPLVYQINPPDISDDVGYNDGSLKKFSKQYQIHGDIEQKLLETDVYQKWCLFKTNIINDFVKNVFDLAKMYDKVLSIAIFGDPSHALRHKMQDWSTWIDQSWIAIIIPMAYYQKSIRVYEEVKRLNQFVNGRATVYAGIAPAYMKLDVDEHEKQLYASRDAGADGIIMFATQNYLSHHFMGESKDHQELQDMLKKWKEK